MKTRLNPTNPLHVTAVHEGGHTIASLVQGEPFIRVTIIPNDEQGYNGKVFHHDNRWRALKIDRTDPRNVDWAERAIVAMLAGGMAQRKFSPRSNWRYGAQTDRAGVDRWLRHLLGYTMVPNDPFERAEGIEPFADDSDWAPPSYRELNRTKLNHHHAKYRKRAIALIDRHWDEIKIVARALLERKTLSYGAVRKLLTAARRQ